MKYKKGDLVVLDNNRKGNLDTVFIIQGQSYVNDIYNWYLLKHLSPPHPFGVNTFFINVQEQNLWKLPTRELSKIIDKKHEMPMDVWNIILSFMIRKEDLQILFAHSS